MYGLPSIGFFQKILPFSEAFVVFLPIAVCFFGICLPSFQNFF